MSKKGFIQKENSKETGVHKSTISRELKRNRGKGGSRFKQTDTKAKDRAQGKVNPCIDGSTWSYIEQLICKDWYPEQIQGWMKENQ